MPNWCYTDITFYSPNKDDIFKLRNEFTKVFNDNSRVSAYVKHFLPGVDVDKVHCRGSVIDIDDSLSKTNGFFWFSMHTETAWAPTIGVWREILERQFPNIALSYIAEEPGCDLYEKWDPTNLFYPQTIRVDGCVPNRNGETIYLDEDERSWSSDFKTAKAWLQEILPFEFTLTKGGDDINEKLEEYAEAHHLEDTDEFWISFGIFEECSPGEFEL